MIECARNRGSKRWAQASRRCDAIRGRSAGRGAWTARVGAPVIHLYFQVAGAFQTTQRVSFDEATVVGPRRKKSDLGWKSRDMIAKCFGRLPRQACPRAFRCFSLLNFFVIYAVPE